MTVMQLVINEDSAVFEYRFKLDDFSALVLAHLAEVKATANTKSTQNCEELGAEVSERDFEWTLLKPFIRDVCRWGGFALIGGRVINNNQPERIIESFRAARDFMNRDRPQIGDALREINKLKYLGTPSFASKHLRFLWPEFCPILDSNTTRLGYDFTSEGYAKFAADCRIIANALMERKIENPILERKNEWFVGDVDMALFAQLRGWG